MTDPKPRPDGKCHVCGKARRRPPKGKGGPLAVYASEAEFARDPFCSRVCCEKHHGIEKRAGTALGPDSRRYAALGDAVTVTVAHWIGLRLRAHLEAA